MKAKYLFAAVFFLCLFLYWFTAEAFIFQDYFWGMSEDLARNVISQKAKTISSQSEGKLVYNDNIMDKPCAVSLIFTNKKLSGVTLKWKGTFIGSQVQEVLENKYGKATQANNYMHQYTWGSPLAHSKLTLDYSSIFTVVSYIAPEEYKTPAAENKKNKLNKEMQEF
jgi:hypothetical protein